MWHLECEINNASLWSFILLPLVMLVDETGKNSIVTFILSDILRIRDWLGLVVTGLYLSNFEV